MTRDQAKSAIAKLVDEFSQAKEIYTDPRRFDEAKLRAGFLDPLFEALGWPVKESQKRFGADRVVVIEDRAGRGGRRRPDYGFYVNAELKFYVEAKQASLQIDQDPDAIYQLKSYVWSQRAPLGLLTNFTQTLAFHGAFKPDRLRPEAARIARLSLRHEDYVASFDLMYDTLSREAVEGGSLDRLLAEELALTVRQRGQIERDLFKARGARPVDADFLSSLTTWRQSIAKELARRNDFRGGELTEAVQRFLDRLVFARVAEDRGIERVHTIRGAYEAWQRSSGSRPLYGFLIDLFHRLGPQFNGEAVNHSPGAPRASSRPIAASSEPQQLSQVAGDPPPCARPRCRRDALPNRMIHSLGGLFEPHPLSDAAEFHDDDVLRPIIEGLYYPESPYRFDAMPVELLGAVYEQFLGSVIRVTEGGHRAKVEPKPEVRHAGGVYYTPRHVVAKIVRRVLAPLLRGATPASVLRLRIVDPACGSGSFLLGVFDYLINWHLDYYAGRRRDKKRGRDYYVDADGVLRLTLRKKREILTHCIHGVDIDPQAVEVSQMSLYLKLLENEAEESIALQRSLELFRAERYLPDLSGNLKCGNSLIQPQDLIGMRLSAEDGLRINAFDWRSSASGFGRIVEDQRGFDAVVGNPPYIRVQALREWAPVEVEILKERYKTARAGNYDIYVAFVERGIQLLGAGGRMGFILPSRWWHADYGSGLRELIAAGRHYAEIYDFADDQVFEDPTTYTCISVFTKDPGKSISYVRLAADALRRHGESAKPARAHVLNWAQLEPGAWYPGVSRGLRGLFDRVRGLGRPLTDPAICTRIFQGLKTSLDSVFVLDTVAEEGARVRVRSRALGCELSLERAFLRRLAKGAELKRYFPREGGKALLFPYELRDGRARLLARDEMQARAPAMWGYLSACKQLLEGRERGRFIGKAWYQYGRTQALDVVGLPKLLTPDISDRTSFSIDDAGAVYLLGGAGGGYGLLPSAPELATVLLAILNSMLIEWVLRPPGLAAPFRGGWFSCEARFIGLLPIRLPEHPGAAHELGQLASRAVELHGRLASLRSTRDVDSTAHQIEALQAEIDDRVFRLYELTVPERRAVAAAIEEARQEAAKGSEGAGADPG